MFESKWLIVKGRRLVAAVALLAAGLTAFAPNAQAQRARLISDGTVKIRFYYDQPFYAGPYFNFNPELQSSLMSSLQQTGLYNLGLKFEQDTRAFNFIVSTNGIAQHTQMDSWMKANLPNNQSNLVNILIIGYPFATGAAGAWYPGGNSVWVTSTYSNGRDYGPIRDSMTHEVGHRLMQGGGLWPEYNPECRNAIKPIMCHASAAGNIVGRRWDVWKASDIIAARRTFLNNPSLGMPRAQCYEFSGGRTQCTNYCHNVKCIVTDIRDTSGYELCVSDCMANECAKICR